LAFKLVMLPEVREVERDWARRLADELLELNIVLCKDQAQAEREIGDADGALGSLDPSMLARARRLRWLQSRQAAPPAGYYSAELVAHPVAVTNMREIFNDHISAHIMAFILAFARGLHHYLPQQLSRNWAPRPENTGVVHLPDATLLLVGVGGIGAETARVAAAFGMTVIGTDARRAAPAPGVSELYGPEALDTLLPRADFVVLTVPHTPATEGLMDRERFRRMKQDGFFINIGRGRTTKLDDLVAALEAGEIAGAALDVFEEEPLPADHPLWTMPNVLITPHMAGYGPHLDERRFEILRHNCRAMLEGSQLRNLVDKAAWF
jgi:phosphoglycerate dehydrogenase-like enzyme